MKLFQRFFFVLALGLILLPGLTSLASAGENYNIDPVHSFALFKVKHLGLGTVFGRFNDVSGAFFLDRTALDKSNVTVQVKTESIDTSQPKRDQHLKSPDFFNAKQFPAIAFKSTQVKITGKDSAEVTGDLTLHGVTKAVIAKVQFLGEGKDPWGGYRTGFEISFSVKRSDFGMTFMLDGVSDEVQITAAIEGIKQ